MGNQKIPRPNEALADFFSDNRIFADLFNAYAFHGEEVLHADDLLPEDTAYVQTLTCTHGVEKIGKYRDIIRKSTLNARYVIFGLETQNRIHYAMPVRAMLYDALGYVTECRSLGKIQEQTGWTADEYLSHLARDTCLTPVFTLVFYTGEEIWDGPVSLHGMLDMDDRLKPFVSDYSLNLVDAGHSSGNLPFRTQALQELFCFLPAIYSGADIRNDKEISGNIVSLAGILAGSESLYRIGMKGDVTVCRALDELEQRGIQKGMQRGELRLSALGQRLLKDERLEELCRSFQDSEFREQLYLEYGI